MPQSGLRIIRRVTVLHVIAVMSAISAAAHAQDVTGTPAVIPPWMAEVVAVLGWPGVVAYCAWQAHRSIARFSTALEKSATAYAPTAARLATVAEQMAPAWRQSLTEGVSISVAHDVGEGVSVVRVDGAG